MNNFHCIKKSVDVSPFLKELEEYLKHSEWHKERSSLYEQQNTVNINLRTHVLTEKYKEPPETPFHMLRKDIYPYFQKTYSFLEEFAHHMDGELCRAMIVSLKPHSQVYKHFDKGSYYIGKDRYHVVLKTTGSKMTCGNESSTWHAGELWWFNNKLPHEAFNEGDEERIHIIFDILPSKLSRTKRLMNYVIKKYALAIHEDTN